MATHLKSTGKLIDLRNSALLQVGFFGAFRRSGLVAIHFEHITFVPEGMEILIPRSKTDQGCDGRVCVIPYGDEVVCPVKAIKNWCEKATQGPVFCRITKGGNIMPFGIDAHHNNIIINSSSKDCNLPNADIYSSHSLRRSFATTASQQGASLASIMQQGRWQHTGTALGYMEEGKRFEGNAAGLILKKRNKAQYNADEKRLKKSKQQTYFSYFTNEFGDEELARDCTLSSQDKKQIIQYNKQYRIHFAIQLCALRLYGRFIVNVNTLSPKLIDYITSQLSLPPTLQINAPTREGTLYEQRKHILRYLKFTKYNSNANDLLEKWIKDKIQQKCRFLHFYAHLD